VRVGVAVKKLRDDLHDPRCPRRGNGKDSGGAAEHEGDHRRRLVIEARTSGLAMRIAAGG
jgi:hypothetical protein